MSTQESREFPEKEAGIFWEYLRSFWTGRKTSGGKEGKKISENWEEKSGKNCGRRKKQKRNWLQTRGIQMLSQRAEEKNFRRNQMKGKLGMWYLAQGSVTESMGREYCSLKMN